VTPIEKRLGAILILITNKASVPRINTLFSEYSEIILGRQGLPLRDRGINLISLVIEGATDQINALTGKMGRLDGVEVKSILSRHKEDRHGDE
jgi:putative iron-only hydrogenase system regulator